MIFDKSAIDVSGSLSIFACASAVALTNSSPGLRLSFAGTLSTLLGSLAAASALASSAFLASNGALACMPLIIPWNGLMPLLTRSWNASVVGTMPSFIRLCNDPGAASPADGLPSAVAGLSVLPDSTLASVFFSSLSLSLGLPSATASTFVPGL